MVKLQFTGEVFVLTIPKDMVEQADWKKGDRITVSFNERANLELRNLDKAKRDKLL